MKNVRATLRLLLLCAWTAILISAWLIGMPFTFFDPGRLVTWRGVMVRRWARGLTRIMGMRIEVTGTPPEPPCCLVANHLSYLDVFLLQTQLRGTFVAKAEVSAWPLIGWLPRVIGTLFINRELRKDVLRINARIEAALAHGDGVVFFPEGTSSKGDRVYPFKPSLLEVAARGRYPVAFAALGYRTPPGQAPAHMALCWWGDMTFADHLLNVLRFPYFYATVAFGTVTTGQTDRKTLAAQLHEEVQRHFIPVVEEEKQTV